MPHPITVKDNRILASREITTRSGERLAPCSLSAPSFALMGTMTKAAAGSAHHNPKSAFRSRRNSERNGSLDRCSLQELFS